MRPSQRRPEPRGGWPAYRSTPRQMDFFVEYGVGNISLSLIYYY